MLLSGSTAIGQRALVDRCLSVSPSLFAIKRLDCANWRLLLAVDCLLAANDRALLRGGGASELAVVALGGLLL